MAHDPVPAGLLRRGGAGVLGGDACLDDVRRGELANRPRQDRVGQQRQSLIDFVATPVAPVLVGEQDQPTVVADPRVASGVLQQHQR